MHFIDIFHIKSDNIRNSFVQYPAWAQFLHLDSFEWKLNFKEFVHCIFMMASQRYRKVNMVVILSAEFRIIL